MGSFFRTSLAGVFQGRDRDCAVTSHPPVVYYFPFAAPHISAHPVPGVFVTYRTTRVSFWLLPAGSSAALCPWGGRCNFSPSSKGCCCSWSRAASWLKEQINIFIINKINHCSSTTTWTKRNKWSNSERSTVDLKKSEIFAMLLYVPNVSAVFFFFSEVLEISSVHDFLPSPDDPVFISLVCWLV